jgi:putative DNA primase/helicase
MRADLPTLKKAARLLGGEVVAGGNILCPGPGHSANDRSLSVEPSHNAPDGFTVKSFCDDDFRDCRDHVREKLGLAPWQPVTAARVQRALPSRVGDRECRQPITMTPARQP